MKTLLLIILLMGGGEIYQTRECLVCGSWVEIESEMFISISPDGTYRWEQYGVFEEGSWSVRKQRLIFTSTKNQLVFLFHRSRDFLFTEDVKKRVKKWVPYQ